MKRTNILPALLIPIAVALGGFQVTSQKAPPPSQPLDERAAQNGLAQAKDPLWGTLAKCRIGYDESAGLYTIAVIPEVKAMSGQIIRASGFVLPLDGSDMTKHFLLTRRTPVCFFCPPGEPNEVMEVRSKKAIAWTDDIVTMSGQFKLINDGEKGVFFALFDAEKAKKAN